ncbi:hypothetical protein FQP85_08380 [Pseudoalteromonas neustonica]|uniref:Terminase n=1 Tax=Pseudoalteromonas neustonica TaxID=1840331 RepID=A0ABY3FE93_9GAMM|nr:hypothetical protein [Pseudoalteromonas neustonica]TVU83782.1 hypothetical protein FQP85_08380 [Pseudoalteromonas neustonica]
MQNAVTPLPGDVQRILTFDELPPRVRKIPEDFNPIADGVLMAHQRTWLEDKSDLKICEKGRRTGITYATALDKTIVAASSGSAGGDNVYYVGDTKEKGLEFIGYCAHMAKVMACAMADGFMGIEVFLFEDQKEDGSSKKITAYRIRFASGFQIVALSSNAANIRGLQGHVVVDEAAFHRDVQAVIDAGNALLIWGGNITIISTHNGEDNPFNQLIKDSREGIFDYSIHKFTFDDAVENGLFERVCIMKGWKATEEKKRRWYNKIRRAYGSNHDAMHEELDAQPRQGSGVAISGVLIESCMHTGPVVKLELPKTWVEKPVEERKAWCEKWIKENLEPLFKLFDPKHLHYFGFDYGRVADLSSIAPLYLDDLLVRKFPFIVEMSCVPSAQQEQILWAIIRAMPNFQRGGMDATGSGEGIAERTADKFGHDRIEQIKLNDAWYRRNGEEYQKAYTEKTISVPRHKNVKADIRSLAKINGIIKLPALRQVDLDNQKIKRHGDTAISTMIGYSVSFEKYEPPAGANVPKSADQSKTRPSRLQGRTRPGGLFKRITGYLKN